MKKTTNKKIISDRGLVRFIVVKLEVEATHNWPACPLREVIFLRSEHRHIFKIECKKRVNHNEREIEIILFKRRIARFLSTFEGRFGSRSCEGIAEMLLCEFGLASCTVLEDGENGAEVIA